MDPFSLSASIIAVVGVGAQIIKLLRKLALHKELPPLALALKDELSDLRLKVSAGQTFLRQLQRSALTGDHDGARESEILASVVRCLERGNILFVQLDGMLSPLLDYSLRPDVAASKKWIKWLRKEKKLKRLKDDLYCFKVSLTSALGFLSLISSTRLDSLYNVVTKIRQTQLRLGDSYNQDVEKLQTTLNSMNRILDLQKKPAEHDGRNDRDRDAVGARGRRQPRIICKPSPAPQIPELVTAMTNTGVLDLNQSISSHCNCSCHERHSTRTPRLTDKFLGTLFGSFDVPYSSRECLSCIRSCPSSQFMFSLTYFFPFWLLSWAITLSFQKCKWGLDHSFRVINCVSFSSPIFQHAYQGHVSEMKSLLKARLGSPFDVTPETQKSLLVVAASRGHGEICEILLFAGADPFFVDYKNRSAVDIAWDALLTNKKYARKLVCLQRYSSGEKYVKKYKMGHLHKKVLGLGGSDLKRSLENSYDCPIDEKDAYGQTALYWAALSANMQAVSDLLRGGADCNIKSNSGHGILTAALMSNNSSCVRKILEFGCEVNYTDAEGYTPLHHSCRYSVNIDVIEALLDRGADKNAKTMLGHSPLMIATFNKQTVTARFLIDSQADIDMQGKDGRCALHFAVMAGDHETVRNLLEHRANHRQKSKSNETLLHFVAERNEDLEMIRTLEPFSLRGINPEDKSKPRMVTALQAAEKHPIYDKDWFKLFDALVSRVRLENLDPEHEHPVQRLIPLDV